MQYTTLPLLLLLVVALLSRCADPGSTDEPDAVPSGDTASEVVDQTPPRPFEGTTDTTYVSSQATASVLLTDVRVAQREGYDRVVFEFEGDELPGYAVEYVTEATHCASGYPVDVEAPSILRVQIAPAAAHEFDDEDQRHSTVESAEHLNKLDAIAHSRIICDHHGGVEWAIGTTEQLPYRTQTLHSPGRIVVDVRHP